MNVLIICYKLNGILYFDSKKDFKEILQYNQNDNIEVMEEKFCCSKKEIRQFEKICRINYLNK